jgi:hypothetical protein
MFGIWRRGLFCLVLMQFIYVDALFNLFGSKPAYVMPPRISQVICSYFYVCMFMWLRIKLMLCLQMVCNIHTMSMLFLESGGVVRYVDSAPPCHLNGLDSLVVIRFGAWTSLFSLNLSRANLMNCSWEWFRFILAHTILLLAIYISDMRYPCSSPFCNAIHLMCSG